MSTATTEPTTAPTPAMGAPRPTSTTTRMTTRHATRKTTTTTKATTTMAKTPRRRLLRRRHREPAWIEPWHEPRDGRPGPLDPVGAFGHVPVAVASPDRHRGRGDLDGVRPPTAHESSVEPVLGGPVPGSTGRRAVRSFMESTPTERPASTERKEK